MSRFISTLIKTARIGAPRNFSTFGAQRATAISPNVLNSIEVSWKQMNEQQREELREQLQDLQKQDWSKLSIEEKRAAYYVAFGEHGPRQPLEKYPMQIFLGVLGAVGGACALFFGLKTFTPPPPHTLTREWQEATNEKMRQQKANPISGYTSEGYQGKGWVDSE